MRYHLKEIQNADWVWGVFHYNFLKSLLLMMTFYVISWHCVGVFCWLGGGGCSLLFHFSFVPKCVWSRGNWVSLYGRLTLAGLLAIFLPPSPRGQLEPLQNAELSTRRFFSFATTTTPEHVRVSVTIKNSKKFKCLCV